MKIGDPPFSIEMKFTRYNAIIEEQAKVFWDQ